MVAHEEQMQKVLREIIQGARQKFTEPLWQEQKNLQRLWQSEQARQQEQFQEVLLRLQRLEEKIQQMPGQLLAALRDAISQAGS